MDIPQDKLGVKVGLDESTASARISRYETGTHEPPAEMAAKLAKALRVPLAYLYCEDDELASAILGFAQLPSSERKQIAALIASKLE